MDPTKKEAYEMIVADLQLFRTRRSEERQANVRACPHCEGLVEIVLVAKYDPPVYSEPKP